MIDKRTRERVEFLRENKGLKVEIGRAQGEVRGIINGVYHRVEFSRNRIDDDNFLNWLYEKVAEQRAETSLGE